MGDYPHFTQERERRGLHNANFTGFDSRYRGEKGDAVSRLGHMGGERATLGLRRAPAIERESPLAQETFARKSAPVNCSDKGLDGLRFRMNGRKISGLEFLRRERPGRSVGEFPPSRENFESFRDFIQKPQSGPATPLKKKERKKSSTPRLEIPPPRKRGLGERVRKMKKKRVATPYTAVGGDQRIRPGEN